METSEKVEKLNQKDNQLLNNLIYALIYMGFTFLIEIIGALWIGISIFPKYFLLDFGIILTIAGVIFFVPNKTVKIIISAFFIFLSALICSANGCLYKNYGDIFYFDVLKLMGEGLGVFSFKYLDMVCIFVNLVIFICYMVCIILVSKKIKITKFNKKTLALLLGIFLIVESSGLSSLLATRYNLVDCSETSATYVADSDAYLYDTLSLKVRSYESFGLYGFYSKEIADWIDKYVFPSKLDESSRIELLNYVEEGRVEANSLAPLYGDNFIAIMCESFEYFAIDPFYTPTLYDFFYGDDSVKLTNYYSKHKTNVSEDISILGNMPLHTHFDDCLNTYGFSAPYSLPNLFKSFGTETANYFHTYSGKFYDRNIVNKAIGFDDVITIDDVDVGFDATGWLDFAGDDLFLSKVISQLAPTDKSFMSYFTTVKMHGDYDNTITHLEKEWEMYNNEETYSKFLNYMNTETDFIVPEKGTADYKRFSNYKVAAINLDNALKMLLDYLETNNLMSSTTILMFADHYAFMDDLSYKLKNIDKSNIYDSSAFNVPCAILSSKLAGQKIESYTTVYDLYPTICSLYGLPYNKNLTQGYDIFSEDIKDALTVSYICGIFTDKLYSRDLVNVYLCPNCTATEEEIYNFKVNASKFYIKQNKIDLIYEYDILKNYIV